MIAQNHELLNAATRQADATLELVDALRTARAWQWDISPRSRISTATGVIDPTAETATPASRLQLRARTLEALAAMEAATNTFTRAVVELTAALGEHQTPDPHRSEGPTS